MKIAVIGAGAIGGLVAGYLSRQTISDEAGSRNITDSLAGKGQDVSLIGHPASVEAIKKGGLEISGVRGDFKVRLDAYEKLKERPDLVILAVKTQDIDTVFKENPVFLKDTLVLTTQNGVQADNIVAGHIAKENIVSSIVMFGATALEPGKIVHNFEGNWIIGRISGGNDEKVAEISAVLSEIFPVVVAQDITGMKYLKIFVNANNCIAAILGVSMQEAFCDPEVSRISVNIWKEGLGVVDKAGISLVSLPDFPLERLMKLTSLPITQAAKVFSGIMTNLSKEPLYGSILQSIKRGRLSEIDYINGEFVSLAQRSGVNASLNKKLVEMVHQVEKTKRFFSKDVLIQQTKELVS